MAPYTVRDSVIDLMRGSAERDSSATPARPNCRCFAIFRAIFAMCSACTKGVVVGMAEGYAQATRNASFVSLHSAAGVGNAMGVIFTAYKNRTPLVVMAGQQARSILPFDPFLFSANAVELPKPYVKWSIEPARADDVPLAIARAYHIAPPP